MQHRSILPYDGLPQLGQNLAPASKVAPQFEQKWCAACGGSEVDCGGWAGGGV